MHGSSPPSCTAGRILERLDSIRFYALDIRLQPIGVTGTDTLHALKIATAVQASGSFSAAARQAGVTPAAVAKLMAQLESRLNVRLFDRTTHHLSVTDEGRDLLERIATPLRDVEDALASTDSTHAKGAVKVSVPGSFARMAVIPTLPVFQRHFPDVQIDLRLENRRVDLVAERYDCAVGASLSPDSSLVARPLATLRACALRISGVPRGAWRTPCRGRSVQPSPHRAAVGYHRALASLGPHDKGADRAPCPRRCPAADRS